MNNNIGVSIIIVNYNGEKYLEECINSVYDKCKSLSFEIIVFDNASKDNSIIFLKENFPEITLIESKENLGFAAGNNRAVQKAKGRYILLLNNDTVLLDDFSSAIQLLESDKNVGAIGIKMLNGKKEYIPSFGKFPGAFSLLRISNLGYTSKQHLTGNFNEKSLVEVDWLTGAFLLTKKDYWNKINGLDEDYFMYVEDVDFCKKLNDIGLKSVFLPNISFIHYVGFNPSREINLIKGYFIYISKHFNKFEKLIAKTLLQINYVFKSTFKNIR